MKNILFRTELHPKSILEFFICETNELDPVRDVLELGIIVSTEGNIPLDGELDVEEIDGLIEYLSKARDYISKFNANSKPRISQDECK